MKYPKPGKVMNSAMGYSEGADLYIQKPIVMDLTKLKEDIEFQIKMYEQTEKEAHAEVIKLKAKLRKLESVTRDAEELFPVENVEHEPGNKGKPDNHA